ncbi:hypothetical protein BPAE_0003g00060 [Botrytis paeoniae]|uniref:Uncharacterized protein n=1 Tax=Botrytis paeoniae TaxID=278948 RepID=A0A4Z1G910_9HELO|nr:hypothetical protein BPAE_0003g00060 [Botrytis paeoniae]
MCRTVNVARYYCDNRADGHRYEPDQWWDGYDRQENPELRNQRFLENPERRPCRYSLNPPLPTDICPAHRAEFGDADSNIIQRNISVLLERLREVSNYRELATGAPDIREHVYFDILYYSRWLDPNPDRNEQYAEYGDHPQSPRPPRDQGNSAHVFVYWWDLKTLESTTIRNEVDAEEGGQARPDVMRRLLFQLYRSKIEYQRAWTLLNAPLAPDI